jgi:cytochrome P450
MATAGAYYDPYDTTIDDDPYPVWRRLRDEAPVYRNDEYGFFALSRHADVQAALLDPKRFRSGFGNVLEMMQPEPFDLPYLVMQDPPRHETHRALVARAFTPRRVAGLADHIRELCRELLDPFVGSGGFDFITDYAARLPSFVISELMGVDAAVRDEVRELIDETFHIEPGVGVLNDRARAAQGRFHAYLVEHVDRRRTEPGDDLITALVDAEVRADDGPHRLHTVEAASLAGELTAAGTETVARLLGWMCALLHAHPDQRATLVGDPALVANAVEETLRYEGPSPVQGRRVVADVELHGTTIPAGSIVLLLTASAGRDERRYEDPDRYDVRRAADGHLAFGHGIHFCIGASLARLEARLAMEEMLRRFPEWELDLDGVVRHHTSTVRGYHHLPIRV